MITVLNDPAGAFGIDRHIIPDDIMLMDWLIEEYGPKGFTVPTTIFRDRVSIECHVDHEELKTGYPITPDDNIIIVHTPQAEGIGYIIVAIVVAVAVVVLTPTPTVPEFKSPTESPNNSLTGQTNIARPQQRIPDIYGKMKVYPDLIAKTYFEFVDHVKIQNEYMCIGRGSYLKELPKTGNTLLSGIDGTVSTFYEPFTAPSQLLDVTESNEVNGQNIIGPNIPKVDIDSALTRFTDSSTIKSTDSTMSTFSTMTGGDLFDISSPDIVSIIGSSNISFNVSAADEISSGSEDLSVFPVGAIVIISGTVSNNRNVKIATSTSGVLTCVDPTTELPVTFTNEVGVSASLTDAVINAGTYTFDSYSQAVVNDENEYTITVTETTFTILSEHPNKYLSQSFKTNEIGPFRVPGDPDQVWFDIQMPKGLQNDGGFYTINLTLRLQEVDSNGVSIGAAEDTVIVLTENSIDPLFYTFKVDPLSPGALYDASVLRSTDSSSNAAILEQTKWTRIAGVENINVTDFGNVSTWFVTTRATEQAVKLQERKFNLVVTRKLPTFDRSTGMMTTTETETAKTADAVVNILTDSYMGNKPISQIDLVGLYDIQDDLNSDIIYGDSLGRFCYSFSNSRTPVNDEVTTSLAASRMFKYQEGNIIKAGRDQIMPVRTTTFNRRIKKPDSENKTIKLFKPNDYDGITLEWVDEDTGDGETIVFPETTVPQNPRRIEAAGIRNYNQAWNLGYIEFNKLIYRRTTVSTTVLRDGLLAFPNARVGNVDSTSLSTQDGEIHAIDGLTVTTSEPIDFQGYMSATVILRGESGQVNNPIVVTERTDNINGFILAGLPVFPITIRGDELDGDIIQMGTLYDFAPDSNHLRNDYSVQEISPGSDGYISLKLINYTDDIYTPDTITPTERA